MVYTFTSFGYEGSLISVETDFRRGIPSTDIVGLADVTVKESRERMYAGIRNSGFDYPSERVLIALCPADLKKANPMELAMSVAVLRPQADDVLVVGEMGLNGNTRPVKGVYAALMTARDSGIKKAIVPYANLTEAQAVQGMEIYGVENLKEAIMAIDGELKADMAEDQSEVECDEVDGVRFVKEITDYEGHPMGYDNMKGCREQLRALQIAMASRSNILFYGSPGCGKTMAMQYSRCLQPLLTTDEAHAVTRIHSLAGLTRPTDGLMRVPPFRMPHQTASIEGVCGGGTECSPGEISLAHNGVLFLDEAAEFRSSVLQMLRVPLESHSITLCRAGRSTVYPAKFQLMMATNPCPCGNYGVKDKICLCSSKSVEQYWKKLGGPLLDRFQIRMKFEKSGEDVVTTEELRKGIAKCVKLARERGFYWGEATPLQMNDYSKVFAGCTEIENIESARARHHVMQLSWTIAELNDHAVPTKDDIKEAIKLRSSMDYELVEL